MEADVTQSKAFLTLWAWADKNKKQLVWGLIAVAVVGLGVAFFLAHQSETRNDANDALSKLATSGNITGGAQPTADSFLKVSTDYAGTPAGQRALLLAAGDLYTAGKYDEAQSGFQKFIKDYNDSKLISQAAIGVAACMDAQGKTNDAIAAYQSVVDRYPTDNVVPQAKLALGRLFIAQGKLKEALNNFQEVARTYAGTTASSEAIMRGQQLVAEHPELLPPPPAPAAATPATHAAPVIRQPTTNQAH